jgi:hypothetical protein
MWLSSGHRACDDFTLDSLPGIRGAETRSVGLHWGTPQWVCVTLIHRVLIGAVQMSPPVSLPPHIYVLPLPLHIGEGWLELAGSGWMD